MKERQVIHVDTELRFSSKWSAFLFRLLNSLPLLPILPEDDLQRNTRRWRVKQQQWKNKTKQWLRVELPAAMYPHTTADKEPSTAAESQGQCLPAQRGSASGGSHCSDQTPGQPQLLNSLLLSLVVSRVPISPMEEQESLPTTDSGWGWMAPLVAICMWHSLQWLALWAVWMDSIHSIGRLLSTVTMSG